MTKYDYLTRLKYHLQPLPHKERVAVIKYYDKYFTDAGPENEEKVMAELGLPRQLAQRILSRDPHTFTGAVNNTKKTVSAAKRELSANKNRRSCLSAALMMLAIAAAGILFALLLAAFVIVILGGLIAVAVLGFVLMCVSVPYLFDKTGLSLMLMGIGIMGISGATLIFMPAVNFVLYIVKKAVTSAMGIMNNYVGRKAANKK